MLELQNQIQVELDRKRWGLEQRMQAQDSFIRQWKIMRCALKNLSEHTSVTLPPFPKLSSAVSSLLAKSRLGCTPVNRGVSGAASAHAVSPEDRGKNGAASAHADSREDHVNNGAGNAYADSSDGPA